LSLELATVLEALLVCFAVGVTTHKARILNLSGLLAAVFVGWPIYVFGSWKWFALLLIFLVISAVFTKYKYSLKSSIEAVQEKNGIRSWQNVFANGGVAAAFAVLQFYFSSGILFAGFVGAVSAATADTLATEIGLISPDEPRLITSLKKKIPAGTSGGVSALGFMAAILGALVIWFSSILLGIWPASLRGPLASLAVVGVGGISGSVFDSVLGATIQGSYRCIACGKKTEKDIHCGERSTLMKGMRSIDNNTVNLLANLFGAFMSISIYLILVL
jgi:uncharacterized protein (TIGR00297 family)